MSTLQSRRSRVPRRAPKACQQCRTAKVRCSATVPCARCTRRRDHCVFLEDDPKVSVSEKYLLDIERRAALTLPAPRSSSSVSPADLSSGDSQLAAAALASRPGWTPPPSIARPETGRSLASGLDGDEDHFAAAAATATARGDDGRSAVFTSNPMIKDASHIQDDRGRYRYMGPTSTWSFYRRAIWLIEARFPPPPQTQPEPFNLDGAAFRLTWTPVPADAAPDVANLPPADYALYLFHTVRFHLGQFFQLIDEPVFLDRLQQLDADPAALAREHRVWFVEYLLVLAFGEAFGGGPDSTNAPAGSAYAARAMALLPDISRLNEEGLPAIEVMALVALYFHSIDVRVAAFLYIGQALRLAYVEGIHREMPEDIVGADFCRRCRTLWWTVYVLDRRMSALIGAPSSIQDGEITAQLPSHKDSSTMALSSTLSIKLSRLLATIMTTVYSVDERLGSSFIKNTRAAIQSLAETAQEADSAVLSRYHHHHHRAPAQPSRMAGAITLMYHHCILQATRPLVMCLLKSFLGPPSPLPPDASHDHGSSTGGTGGTWISPPIVALLKTSITSALTTIKFLRTLEKQRLMESFLPFDLEYAFSSATLLYIVQAILPTFFVDQTWRDSVHALLDAMTLQGSVIARLRRSELRHLEHILAQLHAPGPSVEADGAILVPVATPRARNSHAATSVADADAASDDDDDGQADGAEFWGSAFDVDMMHPDPEHLLDLAFQLGVDSETGIIGSL